MNWEFEQQIHHNLKIITTYNDLSIIITGESVISPKQKIRSPFEKEKRCFSILLAIFFAQDEDTQQRFSFSWWSIFVAPQVRCLLDQKVNELQRHHGNSQYQ